MDYIQKFNMHNVKDIIEKIRLTRNVIIFKRIVEALQLPWLNIN